MQIVDTHCHIDFEVFDSDREQVLGRAFEIGIRRIVVPGVARDSWERLVELCKKQPRLDFALGLHPVFIAAHKGEDLNDLPGMVEEYSPIAIGEIGLDFFLKDLDSEKQRVFFQSQLEIARQFQLPVILHVRKAHDEVIALLEKHGIHAGIAHAFNGSLQQAQRYIQLGFKLGFGGMLTFDRSRKLRELARVLPLEAIVLETDAPDMTVSQHRGQRNSPEYLTYVVQALAEIRQQSPEEICEQTTRNAQDVFNISL